MMTGISKVQFGVLGIAFMFLLMKPLFSQDEPKYLALLTDVHGKVMVKKSDNAMFKKAVWGTHLYEGDRLKTANASGVSILFSNGNLINLGANSSLTISQGPSSRKSKSKNMKISDKELLAELASLTLHRTGEGEVGALAGLRYGGNEMEIELISPRNTKIKSRKPDFSWKSDKEFEKYKVILFGSEGAIWSKEAVANQMDYPEKEEPLQYGKSYFWHVEGVDLIESSKSRSAGFELLTDEEFQEVASKEKSIQKILKENLDRSTEHFVLGNYYKKKGLLNEAIGKFEGIAKMNPDAPLPHQILGNLYSTVGLKDKAIAELQRAMELGQAK